MPLLEALQQLLTAFYDLGAALIGTVIPWAALITWVAFWALAVNWVSLRRVLLSGGWVGAALIMLMTILGWGSIAPPESGTHIVLGLTLSNFVGKTVYVTALSVIALLCGSVQLSGLCGPLTHFDEGGEPDAAPGQSH